ncbi:MAG: PEP-CTERM sorting domain-containing protein [Methylovulum sp.]|nr:PEP-CTERM sorting domain-containing protein [Methylovulum sp.]
MRKIISLLMLSLAASPAFAAQVPEPETFSLIAIGAVGLLLSRRKRK